MKSQPQVKNRPNGSKCQQISGNFRKFLQVHQQCKAENYQWKAKPTEVTNSKECHFIAILCEITFNNMDSKWISKTCNGKQNLSFIIVNVHSK